jgi:hypothetical protein
MPQINKGISKIVQSYRPLGDRSPWPVVCTCLCPMRMPLRAATIHVKEVRNSRLFHRVAGKSRHANAFEMFRKRLT